MNAVVLNMKNIRTNLMLLGEGLKNNSNSKPIIYWRGYTIEVKELNHKVLIVEVSNNEESSNRIIPINKEEYYYLSKCLNIFNKDHK